MSKSLPGEETRVSWDTQTNSLSPRDRLLINLRTSARERFWSEYDRSDYECPSCGSDDAPIEVHHRDGDPFNNHLVNLIGVCHNCHQQEHKRRATVAAVSEWKDSAPIS